MRLALIAPLLNAILMWCFIKDMQARYLVSQYDVGADAAGLKCDYRYWEDIGRCLPLHWDEDIPNRISRALREGVALRDQPEDASL